MLSCRDMAPWLSTHSAPSKRGKGGGASHQKGTHFQRPPGRLYGFRRQRRHKKRRPKGRHTFPAERYYIPPEGGALNPSGRRQPVPDRTLGAQGQRPGGAINPRGEAASTFGNTGKHRLSPDPDPGRRRRLNPQAPKGLVIYPVSPVSLPGLCILLRRGVLLWPLLWPGRRWRRPGGLCLHRG